MKLKKKKKLQKKNWIITVTLLIVAVTVGTFAFISWQNKPTIIQTANLNKAQLPTSGEREVVKRLTLESGEPDHISIPDRGIETPIIYITQDKNNEEGHQEALAKGVVHFPGTAVPGEYGNPYIFGHSSDYFWKPGDYKQIFKPLIDIPLDTEIRITNHDGELFIYRIIETKIVGPKEVSVLDQYNYERKMLTLQTSWPLNTALKRYLAIAELDEEATYGTAN
jgi:LPXTG-site transpeptidase (sortase) family protein